MANLQVKDIDDRLYESIRVLATNEKRSISQEVVYILQKYLSKPKEFDDNPTDDFLNLAGSWKDDRDAEKIIADMRSSRKNSSRFGISNELFD
jgi:plasmid stability protein